MSDLCEYDRVRVGLRKDSRASDECLDHIERETPAYMENPTMATWKEENRRHWEELCKFYSQIGSLTCLGILDLQAVRKIDILSNFNMHREQFLSPSESCLPGLLALKDAEKGKIGYLEKLTGLARLQELRVS